MAHATAAYRLNPEMREFLGTGLMRLIVRGENVIGHFGRRGYLTGALRGQVLTATLRDGVSNGELCVTFDESFTCFDGVYTSGPPRPPQTLACSGKRITRRRL
ncbi:MAG TPA: hypothetical protein VMV65_04455 [Alphaproteobacteria bacterium]|nr:hypothetical protein [Alphaproteobacteria bacterium]